MLEYPGDTDTTQSNIVLKDVNLYVKPVISLYIYKKQLVHKRQSNSVFQTESEVNAHGVLTFTCTSVV